MGKKSHQKPTTRISYDEWANSFVNPEEFKKDFEHLDVKLRVFILKYGAGSFKILLEQILD